MSFASLIRQVGPDDLDKLPSRQRNIAKIEEFLTAYGFHLQGLSQRGVQKEMGHKHLRTTQNQIRRGEEIAKALGLDTERLRLKLAAAFEQLADISIQQIKEQAADGRITQIARDDGFKEVRKTRGVDPRLIGEAGRGLIRFAQFAGLMDSDASTGGGEVSTNVVFIQPTGDGAAWDQLQTQAPVVDVSAMATDVSEAPEKAVQDSGDHSCNRDQPKLLNR
jgi:hypothetical protein